MESTGDHQTEPRKPLEKERLRSIAGFAFFGVPNRGMDIASFRSIVGNSPNRYLLEPFGHYSDLLREQELASHLPFILETARSSHSTKL